MNKTRIFYFASIFIVLSLINIASAQTLVAGKIYDADYSSNIAGAEITVTCDGSILNTISIHDGTYAVRFEVSECVEGSTATATASNSGFYSKTSSGVVTKCDSGDCGEEYFTIINLGLDSITPNTESTSSSGGGGGGRFYLCGNGICDTGENIDNCDRDCTPNEMIDLKFETGEGSEDLETNSEENQEPTQEQTQQTGLSKITGAIIGTLEDTGLKIFAIFSIILIILLIIVKILGTRFHFF